jgi:glycosyltransferase involved in cell wall biosynthesis
MFDAQGADHPTRLFTTGDASRGRSIVRTAPPFSSNGGHGDPLRVGIIAPAWVPVPPPVYGGTELVVDNTARGLLAAGHDVRLFATGDSSCPVPLRWLHDEAVGSIGSMMDELTHVQAAYQEFSDVDVIHDHTMLGPLWAHSTGARPVVVTTNHGPFDRKLTEYYKAAAEHLAVVAISHHQASTGPDVPIAEVIHHGLDVDRLPVGAGDGGFVLFLGRMHPSKGVHRAIDVARAAGKKLVIAAKMWEAAEREYYAAEVEPRLGAHAEYIGEVGGSEKAELIGQAEALVNPIRWPEPFGLVMIEALAAGTPVLAFPEGAAPEIVDHGVTGFLATGEVEMAGHLATIDQIDRDACRRAAEDRFSTRAMVDNHVALYRRLLSARRQAAELPRLSSTPPSATESLLQQYRVTSA